jgi:hypothetical protein
MAFREVRFETSYQRLTLMVTSQKRLKTVVKNNQYRPKIIGIARRRQMNETP